MLKKAGGTIVHIEVGEKLRASVNGERTPVGNPPRDDVEDATGLRTNMNYETGRRICKTIRREARNLSWDPGEGKTCGKTLVKNE